MSEHELQWQPAIPKNPIYPNQIHIWRVHLDISKMQRESLMVFLSADEVARARRFHFEIHQKRFIASRGILRQILSHYLRKNPKQIRFEYSYYGKPRLVLESGENAFSFNLSHSGGIALYAISLGRSIGIDIERVNNDVDIKQVSERFYSPGEISSLERTGDNKRNGIFFQYWTRKEAFLKAIGKGVSFPMEQVDVSLQKGMDWSRIVTRTDNLGDHLWLGMDLIPGHNCAAAVVVEEGACDLVCRDYSL